MNDNNPWITKTQRLPCQDITATCIVNSSYHYVQKSTMTYRLNIALRDKLINNKFNVYCYWVDIYDLYDVVWDGTCGDDIIYYSHPIELDINIRFDIEQTDKYISHSYQVCNDHFGDTNETISTLHYIDWTLENLLSLSTYHSLVHDVLKYPNTSFKSDNISHLNCDSQQKRYYIIAELKTLFVIESISNK
eukprot:219358_1